MGVFQPGNPGGGKRKEKLMFDALMLSLKRVDTENRPAFARIANKLVDMALDGDIQAIKEINNRIDGMPVQQIEQTTEHKYVAELPSVIAKADEWLQKNKPDPQTVQ